VEFWSRSPGLRSRRHTCEGGSLGAMARREGRVETGVGPWSHLDGVGGEGEMQGSNWTIRGSLKEVRGGVDEVRRDDQRGGSIGLQL
jgi:hypothetical protein